MRNFKLIALAAAALCLPIAGCGGAGTAASPVATPAPVAPKVVPSIWAGSWGAAMTNNRGSDNTGSEQSFRFLVNPTLGGTQARLRFSNVYGSSPVTIGAARLGVGQDGSAAVDPATNTAVTFNGQASITIPAGGTAVSDAANVTFKYGQVLAISVYLKGAFTAVSRHDAIFITNFRSPANSGDTTADSAGTSFTETLPDWLLVTGVDVYGPYKGTLALFGSSTTDGFHSNYSSDQVYPVPNVPLAGQHTARLSDWVAQRLNAAGYQVGVVNPGIPADSVTADSSNQINQVKNANDRIAQDVLTLPNLLGVVTYFGSIDLRSGDCKSAPAMETATTQLINTAAAARLPLVLATLPPSAFCTNPAQSNYGPFPNATDPYAGGAGSPVENGAEVQRAAFNAWVRQMGAQTAGVVGIADFDGALADPNRPSFMRPMYNSGDNYHPNGAGYKAESDAIPLVPLVGTP